MLGSKLVELEAIPVAMLGGCLFVGLCHLHDLGVVLVASAKPVNCSVGRIMRNAALMRLNSGCDCFACSGSCMEMS